jgi:4-amino-4-deoxy-L-arabinose transferase-like glycosyltransferase
MLDKLLHLPSQKIWFCFAVVVFLTLSIGSSLTHRPQIDDGLFANPALNLATDGTFGTTVLETENSPLVRINERTFWVMPAFLLNVAAFFKVFGFSLFAMRLVSVFWGSVLLASCFLMIKKLSGSQTIALFGLLLLACDYVVLDNASSGRMDMMSAALGFAALAAFLALRERNLLAAILASQTLVVASGLTHPNGIMPFAGLLFLTVYFDRRKIGLQHIAVALAPYLVGGAAFAWWILQDAEAFRAQFVDNVVMGGRMKGFGSPAMGFVREFTDRYPQAFGLGNVSGGHSAPVYLKSLILIGYAVGLLGALLTRELRANRNYRALLVLTGIYFVVMSLIDGQKETPYLIHIVPFYLALLALWLDWAWRRQVVPKPLIAFGLLGFLALQTGGMMLRISKNTFSEVYQPAIDFLKANATEKDVIMGGAELGFGLKFPPNLISDGRFGYATGKRPKFIVFDDAARGSWEESKEFAPELYEYIPRLLNDEYTPVYENAAYKIYERRTN